MPRSGDGIRRRKTKAGKASWWLDVSIHGKRHTEHLGTGISRSVAKELADVRRAAILQGEAGIRKRKRIRFGDAVARFLDRPEIFRQNTIKFYKDCFWRLGTVHFGGTESVSDPKPGEDKKKFAGGIKLSQITKFTIDGYKRKRMASGVTIRPNRELVALRALFYYCIEVGLYEGENPLRKIKLPFKERDQREEEPRFLSDDEQGRLIDSSAEPLRTIVIAGLNGGFRVNAELLPLKWGAVDFDQKRIVVESNYSKNHRRRSVPMNSTLFDAMVAHRDRSEKTRDDDFVFRNKHGAPYRDIRTAFYTARRRAGLGKDITAHCLRHTWASSLIKRGVDPEALRRLGGWSSYRMVQRYAHVDDDHLRASVEKISAKTEKNSGSIPTREVIGKIG